MSRHHGSGPAHRLFVPGRIEVLGKHTDYAGGRSLLAAVNRGFSVDVRPTDGGRVTVSDAGWGESVTVTIPSTAGSGPGRTQVEPGWAVYVRTVVHRLARDFPGRLRGCDITLSSDLPAAAGLSSSSALITALFLALDAVSGLSRLERYRAAIPDRAALAGYLSALERGSPFPGLGEGAAGVGTRGGSEDHVAMLCARPDALVRYAFEPVRSEGVVPMPDGYRFVVAASGVRAVKTGEARERYNHLSDDAARIAELWRATGRPGPHLGAILAGADVDAVLYVIVGSADDAQVHRLERRLRHFAVESEELVPTAAESLAQGDLSLFGDIVDRSQARAAELLGNQIPETQFLASSARELGAVAASAFGAGFGGSVWALVETHEAQRFAAAWRARYRSGYPAHESTADFFMTPASLPARSLET